MDVESLGGPKLNQIFPLVRPGELSRAPLGCRDSTTEARKRSGCKVLADSVVVVMNSNEKKHYPVMRPHERLENLARRERRSS